MLILANSGFADEEAAHLAQAGFTAKPREKLTPSHPLKFNGGLITLEQGNAILLSQERQGDNLETVTSGDYSEYVAQRARGAYIASVCQPGAAFDLSSAAQHTKPGTDEFESLNTRIAWQIGNKLRGLCFVAPDESTLSDRLCGVHMRDDSGSTNIMHWSSTKCKRVTRSVLAADLYALTHGFDIASSFKTTLEEVYGRQVLLVLCTDSRSIFDNITQLGTTQEKRLMIDVQLIRQAYERREVAEIKWIPGTDNPADAMAKPRNKACAALEKLTDTNRIHMAEEVWVELDQGRKG